MPMITFVPLLWTGSNRSMSFLCWDPRAGCSTAGGVSHSRAEGQNPLPGPAAHAVLNAAEDTVSFLGWEHTLLAQFSIQQYPKSFFTGLLTIHSYPRLS